MKNILVPTDLSELAENGLKVAVDIGRRVNSTIYLVNFIKHPFGTTFTATGDIYTKYAEDENLFTVQLIRKHQAELSELAQKYSEPGLTIETLVYDEELVDGIEDFLRKYNIDLIVMGTTGEENFQEKFTGNHAEQVIGQAKCPVISVKEDYRVRDMHHIVVGWDMNEQEDYSNAVNYINELSQILKARLDVIHVAKPGFKNQGELENKMKSFARDHNLTNFSLHIVENDDIEDGILQYAHKVQAGIIVMLSQVKSGMARFFTHSSSEEMSRDSDIPVFTVNLHNI